MNIDELRTVQTKERQKDSLQHLRDAFYEDVADYITDLKAERDRAAAEADDPFSDPDVSRLTDEIETAEEVIEAIYERRVGKVVKLSSFAAADMPVDEEGLTAQERDLFEDLVTRIGENKTRVLDILAGAGDAGRASSPVPEEPSSTESTPTTPERPVTDDENPDSSPARTEPAVGAGSDESTPERDSGSNADPTPAPADPQNGAVDEVVDADRTSDESEDVTPRTESTSSPASKSNSETAPEAPDGDRTTVRITADVGSVLGVDDREYDLQSEDVVALPADNADALLQRDAAEKLE